MEEYQFDGRVAAGVTKRCQRCHDPDKLYTDFDIRRRIAALDGRILVTVSGQCLQCIREVAAKRERRKHIPTGGKSGTQEEHQHYGPDRDSVEYLFFCT